MKYFSAQELVDIYNQKVKKSPEYFQKYASLEPYIDDKIANLLNGKDYPRVPCVLDFKEWIKKYNIIPEKLLCTCSDDFELSYIDPKIGYLLQYEISNNTGDLHTFNLTEKDFDFIIFSQTLEHLYNPFVAVEKIYEHVRPGGFVFTSVPAINIPHLVPFHFSGIYPMGLAVLFESAGFTILEMGQWGNLHYLEYIFKHHGWPDYEYLKSLGRGTITNEEANIAQCWCLAQKITTD
ncbi:MAG: hypothetical protein DCF19_03230 [Pseudanabaena frigida]|uniref:Uncharacterized protein n=1 Tax=Pseudanabaena frigida TaxID=945775 RepID=A0A2W4WM04_9CYAN|nr:MAG: hypothetical protein DCF19_03230 [Pseudanabaena frigida]